MKIIKRSLKKALVTLGFMLELATIILVFVKLLSGEAGGTERSKNDLLVRAVWLQLEALMMKRRSQMKMLVKVPILFGLNGKKVS
jgi:hypothetical protein